MKNYARAVKSVPGMSRRRNSNHQWKTRLVGMSYAIVYGACMVLAQGAIIIEEREAEPYDEDEVMDNTCEY